MYGVKYGLKRTFKKGFCQYVYDKIFAEFLSCGTDWINDINWHKHNLKNAKAFIFTFFLEMIGYCLR